MAVITRVTDFENGTVADAEQVDSELNVLHNLVNGNIETANILDNGVDLAQVGSAGSLDDTTVFADGVVETAKLANSAVTTNKLATNAVTKDKLEENQQFKTGMIMLWSGSVASIPSGWTLCDGTDNTPDLTDRFVVGAGGSYAVDNTGGQSNMPQHSHNVNSHNHNLSNDGTHTHTALAGDGSQGTLQDFSKGTGGPSSSTTESAGSHNHGGSTGNSSPGTDNAGSGSISDENRPPYYALAYIMKT